MQPTPILATHIPLLIPQTIPGRLLGQPLVTSLDEHAGKQGQVAGRGRLAGVGWAAAVWPEHVQFCSALCSCCCCMVSWLSHRWWRTYPSRNSIISAPCLYKGSLQHNCSEDKLWKDNGQSTLIVFAFY